MNIDPNGFGATMCIGFVYLLWLRDKAGKANRRVAAMACMAVLGGCIAPVIVRTGSRGAALALAVSILTFTFFSINILAVIKRLVTSLVLLAAIAMLLPDDAIWSITDRWDRPSRPGTWPSGRKSPGGLGHVSRGPLFRLGPFINVAELRREAAC